MDCLNDEPIAELECELERNKLPVITFSHFLPLQVERNGNAHAILGWDDVRCLHHTWMAKAL